VTRDRARRWHIAFAVAPAPVPAPGNGQAAGVDRGVAVSAALSTGELLHCPGLSAGERRRLRRLERKLAKAKRGSGSRRVEKIPDAYTSQRCSACGHVDARSRESQARFKCTACGFALNADVNAARNIAAGHAVTARGGFRVAGPVNREPQHAPLPV
jgi:transposase